MDRSSFFKISGLPDSFGVVLLVFSFILLLAPYFSGADFGLFKIPAVTEYAKKLLKIIGPVLFILCILSFVPIFPVSPTKVVPTPSPEMTPTPTSPASTSNASTTVAANRGLVGTTWQGTQINATGLEGPLHVEFRDNSEALVRADLYSGVRPGPPLGLSEEEMARYGRATVRCIWITDGAGSSVKIDCPRQDTLESNGGIEVPRVLYDLKLQGLSMEGTKTYPESGRTSKCKLNKI